MNKKMLIDEMAEKMGVTKKEAGVRFDAMIDVLTNALVKGEKISISGFGTFEVKERPERIGRNPSTNQAITLPASKALKFKAAKALKDFINQ